MSIELSNVQRLRVYTEPNGSFAVDGTGTLGNFTDVPFIEGSLSAMLDYAELNPEHAQQHTDGYPTQVTGTKSVSLSFDILLAPTGTNAGDGVPQVQSALGEILAAVMGGEDLGTGTTVSDATPGADINTLADASGVEPGAAIGFVLDSGYFQARPVASKSGNTTTMRLNFSEAPDDSDEISASATYYLTQDPNTSLQFVVEGFETQDRWLLRGLQLESMSLTMPIGELPRLSLSFQGAVWDYGDDAATDLTASALAAASYTNVSVIHTVGNFLYQTYNSRTNPTALTISDASFEPNLSYTAVTSPSADAGGLHVVSRYRRTRSVPVISGSFQLPFEDHTYFDDRDARTLKQIWYQLGTVAGKVVCLDVPTVQVTNVQTNDANGMRYQTVSWQAQLDQETTGTTDLTDSAFRIHFL